MQQALWMACVIGLVLLCLAQRKRQQETEKKIQEMAESMAHFMVYRQKKQEETLEEGALANLQNEIAGMEEIFLYQQAKHDEEEARLNQFMENMAHQMKTALTALQIRIDSAQIHAVTEQEHYALARSEECLSRLDGEIGRILSCSQIASGKMKMHFQMAGCQVLIQRCVDNLKPLAEKRKVEVQMQASSEPEIAADAFWMEQALENVIKNALEHTRENGIVKITILDNNCEIRIKVEDEGEGIEETELPHIFERFHRGNCPKTGYGIGLSMASDIVKAHHGTLEAGNRVEGGAWFLLKLPVLEGAKAYDFARLDERKS